MRRTLLRAALGSRWRLGLVIAAGLALTLSSALVTAVGPAQAAATCSVNYVIRDQWNTGFTADVTITNHGAAINGWTLGFSFPGNQKVTNGWNATWSQSGQAVTAKNAGWNGTMATGGSTSIGFNGSYSGANGKPTSFTLNGAACNGDQPPTSPSPSPTASPSPTQSPTTSPPPPGQRVDNPYAGAGVYVNPDWRAAARNGGAPASIYDQPTGVWMDRIAAIDSGSAGSNAMGLADHLDEAVKQDAANGATPLVFQVVIYNLPGRDCAALASNGELGPNDLPRYKSEYIDVIAGIMRRPAYANLRIAAIIEIDSLPNLVTNTGSQPGATPMCDTMKANGGYVNGVGYALATLGAIPNVHNYVDAAHHGWIGWDSNFGPTADLIFQAANASGATPANVHGFITNTANYSALREPYIDMNGTVGGRQIRESKWVDWNRYNDELSFAQAFRNRLVQAGFGSGVGMLIDTSRNGWGGPNRPTGPSASNDLNTFVDESRIDRRIHKGNWCNQAGAGLGERPRATPEPGIDAYVWIKPPGESDGSSKEIPNDEGKGFDRMCDPTYEGNPRNGNSRSGALPDAPLSGHWFQAQFEELLRNAYPPVQ